MTQKAKRDNSPDDPHVLGVVNHAGHVLFKIAVVAVFAFALFYGIRTAYDFGYSVFTVQAAEEL